MTTGVQGGNARRAWWWALLALAIAGAIVFYLLTMPKTVPASELTAHTPDVANGEYIFTAGGCAECHAEPLAKCKDTKVKDKTRLAGGRCLKTPFGVFNVPNISPDKETGIGNWSTLDFVNAMKRGIGPGGAHLYPAFPYTSYQRMTYEDLIDLKTYLDTLPAVKHKTPPHELVFPYNIRRGIGLWQLLYVDGKTFTADPKASDDITYLLETGNTPDFDVIGGVMAPVQENMAKLKPEDRSAIAAYLKSLPPLPDAVPKKKKASGEEETDEEKEGDPSGGETSEENSKQPGGAEQ
jgi:mono/diheme cytochrome c family protein